MCLLFVSFLFRASISDLRLMVCCGVKIHLQFKTNKQINSQEHICKWHIVDIFDSTCDPKIMGEWKTNCLLYADDLILLSQSEHGLQRCLDKLSCYAKKWQMRINIKKTKAIIFNKSGKIFRSEFKLGNQPIQVTDSYVYLGITFTPSGSFFTGPEKAI